MARKFTLKDLIGQRFGKLLVVSRAPNYEWTNHERTYTYAMWNCICDCGNETTKRATHLNRRRSTSCGCVRDERIGKLNRLKPYEALYNVLLTKRGKCKDKYKVEITYEQFVMFTSVDACHYCYHHIKWDEFNTRSGAYNLDRKDDNLSYNMDNLVVCCARCNFGKASRFTYDEWFEAMTFMRVRNEEKRRADANN